MQCVRSPRRPGYTLLEVMLAVAITTLVLAALYAAMDVQFRYMQAGRDAVVEGQIARGVLNRMAGEIRLSLATLPKQTPPTTTTTTTTAEGETEEETTPAPPGQYNYGLYGDEYSVTLFVSTVPRFGVEEFEIQNGVSDLGKITYWLEPEQGLARQEVRSMATDGITTDQGRSDLLASEVVELRFRYYDPNTGDWTTMWDGSTSGPPLAVEILLTVQAQSTNRFRTKEPTTYRMVVHIPTATIPQSSSSTTTGGMSP